jgi:hypothetical protein
MPQFRFQSFMQITLAAWKEIMAQSGMERFNKIAVRPPTKKKKNCENL